MKFTPPTLLAILACTSLYAQTPLWDLTKDKVPDELNHGAIRAENGTMTVGGDTYFGVPASAFPDQKNFTVQVTVSFPQPV